MSHYYCYLLWGVLAPARVLLKCSFVFSHYDIKGGSVLKIKVLYNGNVFCNEEDLLHFKQLTGLELGTSNININFNINNYNSRYELNAEL